MASPNWCSRCSGLGQQTRHHSRRQPRRGSEGAGKATRFKGRCCARIKRPLLSARGSPNFFSLFLVPEEQLSQWLHFANSVFNRPGRFTRTDPCRRKRMRWAAGAKCVLVPVPSGDARPPYRSRETKLGIMPGFRRRLRSSRVCWAQTALWRLSRER